MSVTENNKRIAKNTMYMYLRMLIILFVSLFTARIVFNTLGITDFGIYNVVGSIIVFFSFLNNGLSLSTRRYITAELSNGNDESQNKIFNLACIAHIYIALIVLVLAETVGIYIINSILSIPNERMFTANVVYQLSIISAIVGITMSPFNSAIIANEKMSVYAYLSIIDVVVKLIIIGGVILIPGDKLIVYAILILCGGLLNVFFNVWYCYRTFSMCKIVACKDKTGIKEMFCYMGWSLFGQGSVVLTNQGITLLLNTFCGVVANAAMGISNTITNIVSQFVNNFQIAFNPQITKYYVSGDKKDLYQLVTSTSRYSSYLVLLFLIPLLFETPNFLTVWLGEYPKYAVEFCIFTLFSIFIEAIGAPLWMIIGSDKDIKLYQIIVSAIFLINFIGSFISLSLGFPPFYVIIVRVFVSIILIIFRLHWCKRLLDDFPVSIWCKQVLLKTMTLFIASSILSYLVYNLNYRHILIELSLVSFWSMTVTAMTIYFGGLTSNEKQFLKTKILSKIRYK